jgi:hypothetical protein
MGDNVHEWCLDWYDPQYYEASPEMNPTGPLSGARRVSRGGSWRHRVKASRNAHRSSLPPEFRYTDYGFRLVRDGQRVTLPESGNICPNSHWLIGRNSRLVGIESGRRPVSRRTPSGLQEASPEGCRRLAPGGAQATPGVVHSTPTAPRRGARIIWTAVESGGRDTRDMDRLPYLLTQLTKSLRNPK